MGDIQHILQENAWLKAQILSKDEQILLKDEQIHIKEEQLHLKEEELKRKQERILYLERQLFGRRSEKRLPDYCEAQLSLFDSEQGMKTLEGETPEMKSLVDDIMHKAEKRRNASKEKSTTKKRSYKVPQNIERRETIVNPENVDINTMVRIGQDVNERLMIEPSKFWVERIVRPIYKEKQDVQALTTTMVQAPLKNVILPGCIAGESLLSQIIVDKFLYHLPEYRQAKRFNDIGLEITTSSINRWVHPWPISYIRFMLRKCNGFYQPITSRWTKPAIQ